MRHPIPEKLLALLTDYQLKAEAIEYIKRSRLPSTLPNGRFSYTVRFPCTLTDEILVLQSRDFEFACLLTLLADPNVAYIIAQPATLELDHPRVREKFYSPDFLVFWKDGSRPTLIETKPLTQLATLVAKHPDRYISDGPKSFDLPLVRKKADELGFDVRVIHEGYFTEYFVRNALLLEPYRQWNIAPAATEEEKKAIKDQIADQPGIKFADVSHDSSERRADLIHHMLATGEIFAHLSEESLMNQNRVSLFTTRVRERALAVFHSKNPPAGDLVCPYVLFDGLKFTMRGKDYTIVQSAGEVITVRNSKQQESRFPIETFLAMLPEVDVFHNAEFTAEVRMSQASDRDLAEMLRRHEVIRPWVAPVPGEKKPKASDDRSIQRYLSAYRLAEATYKNGFLGLLPRTSERGSSVPDYPAETVALMNRVIRQRYLRTNPRPTIVEVHGYFSRLMGRLRMGKVPSYRTFAKECEQWDAQYVAHRRWGHRVAKQLTAPSAARSPLGIPHGERPFTVGHCDHTANDVALAHPESAKKLLKAWHTPMVDATTRKVIAHVTRLNSPSTDTLIDLFRDCVVRNQTIPAIVVVDWGPDFRSKWLQESLGQILRTTIFYRQVATGASGAPVEGQFGFNDVQLIHRMRGSTEALKRARLTTGATLPYKNAIWTLKDLREHYEEHYKTFNSTPYGNAKQSPEEREKELWTIYGSHPRAVIPLDVLDRVLLPFVDRVVRKVDSRCRIFVKRTYYASGSLRNVRGKEVTVRYRPSDPTVMLVTHPELEGVVTCKAVSADVKYADSVEDAIEVVVLKNTIVAEVKARKTRNWSKHVERREKTERKLLQEACDAAMETTLPPKEPEPPKPATDNVIPFHYTQGGLKKLLRKGGDK